jgi:hypothetical protein
MKLLREQDGADKFLTNEQACQIDRYLSQNEPKVPVATRRALPSEQSSTLRWSKRPVKIIKREELFDTPSGPVKLKRTIVIPATRENSSRERLLQRCKKLEKKR